MPGTRITRGALVALLVALTSVAWAARADAAPKWLAPVDVSVPAPGTQFHEESAVAMDRAGNDVTVWRR